MLIIYKIGHHTRCSRDHDTTEESTDSTDDNQLRHRSTECTRDNQDSEDGQTRNADRLATIDFTQRRHKHGSDSQTKQVERKTQSHDSLRLVKFIADLTHTRSIGSRI